MKVCITLGEQSEHDIPGYTPASLGRVVRKACSFLCGCGISLPSFFAVSNHSSMAIFTFSNDFSSVSPNAEHPGNSGIIAIYPLSSSL